MPSPKDAQDSRALSDHVLAVLEEHSAQDTIEIDIRGKSSVADYMIVTSGRSNRHVGALADYILRSLKERGLKDIGVEGLEGCDWVLVDAGATTVWRDPVVHGITDTTIHIARDIHDLRRLTVDRRDGRKVAFAGRAE